MTSCNLVARRGARCRIQRASRRDDQTKPMEHACRHEQRHMEQLQGRPRFGHASSSSIRVCMDDVRSHNPTSSGVRPPSHGTKAEIDPRHRLRRALGLSVNSARFDAVRQVGRSRRHKSSTERQARRTEKTHRQELQAILWYQHWPDRFLLCQARWRNPCSSVVNGPPAQEIYGSRVRQLACNPCLLRGIWGNLCTSRRRRRRYCRQTARQSFTLTCSVVFSARHR